MPGMSPDRMGCFGFLGAFLVLEIVYFPHPALRYPSRPVVQIDDALRSVVRSMFDLMYESRGIGLAANQVALPFRFFVLNLTADPEQKDQEKVLINPEIVKRHSSIEDEEGCLSLPGLYAKVRRARKIRVQAYDVEGKLVEHEAEDLFSRAVQHETDHLDGKLFIDYLSPLALHSAGEKLREPGPAQRRDPRRRGTGAAARLDDPSDPGSDQRLGRPIRLKRADTSGIPPRRRGSEEMDSTFQIPHSRCIQVCDPNIYDSGIWNLECGIFSLGLLQGSTMAPPTRIIIIGTGDFALPTFEHLAETGHNLVALVTQPDRPQGRKQELIPSRIKQSALARGILVERPESVNAPESLARIRELAPDLLVTAAYGQILSADLLSIPPLGGINLHGSILPSYRGAAPVARAIQNGETETGVTVIRMTPQIDAGGIIAVARTAIDPDETAGELEDRLAVLGAPLIAKTIAALAAGPVPILPQDRSKVTKAPKLRKEDGLIDWSMPARAVHNLVRAMQPWPVASTTWQLRGAPSDEPVRLIVHKTAVVPGQGEPGEVIEAEGDRLVAVAGEDAVRLLEVQLPGKKRGPVADFLRGHRLLPGDRMGVGSSEL
jgi:methionyl-tRNA formyltransferase